MWNLTLTHGNPKDGLIYFLLQSYPISHMSYITHVPNDAYLSHQVIYPIVAYEWVRDNTPKSSRVMAWWDYGYQITGVVCVVCVMLCALCCVLYALCYVLYVMDEY